MTSPHTPVWQRVLAACGLVTTSPLLMLSATAIKVTSRGPVLYRSMRAGQGARPFTILKLRTMTMGSESGGSITTADDGRIFPVGRLIRRLKLDELPQLVNVVSGDMALVGPRPEEADVVARCYSPWMMETLDVPPGITGPGSLHFFQQERDLPTDPKLAMKVYACELLPQKLALELVYVRSRSLDYELQLIIRTVLGILGGRDPMKGTAEKELVEARQILAKEMGSKHG